MFSEMELEAIEQLREQEEEETMTDTTDTDLTDDTTDTVTAYTPVFNDTVRTIIYVVCLIASVIGLGFMCFGSPDIGGFMSTAAGIIAGGFGVAYNPVRMNN